jgi:hypothetical protein
MPVDPELIKTFVIHAGKPHSTITLVTERGVIARGQEVSLTHPEAEPIEGYVPHWSTCTAPAAHRITRKKGAP